MLVTLFAKSLCYAGMFTFPNYIHSVFASHSVFESHKCQVADNSIENINSVLAEN